MLAPSANWLTRVISLAVRWWPRDGRIAIADPVEEIAWR